MPEANGGAKKDEIGFRIRKRREALGMSMDALSKLSGISKSTISRYEAGLVDKIPIKSIQIISSALKTNYFELLGLEDSDKKTTCQADISSTKVKKHTFFGNNLKKLREKRGLSQKELSEMLKVSASAVSMYENNQREPDYQTLIIISNFFDVDLNSLILKNLKSAFPRKSKEYQSKINITIISDVGKRIREKREEMNLSVEQLATMINKNRSTIYRYENGDMNMPMSAIISISDALQTSPNFLFGLREENDNISLSQFVNVFSKLTEDQLSLIIDVANSFVEANEKEGE